MDDNKIVGAIIVIIILLFMATSNQIPNFPKGLFSAITIDIESQLKGEHNTYWSSKLDGDIITPSGENDKFRWTSSFDPNCRYSCVSNPLISPDGESISTYDSMITKKDFYGQEVVVLYKLVGTEDAIYLYKYIPHTLDNSKVDLYINGFLKSTLSVQKPFYLDIGGGGSVDSRRVIDFIGYKAQFCNIAPDEVWIQESFAQTFSNKDLSFPATKYSGTFCNNARPFTLRDLQQGESPIIPDPIPSFNRGISLTPLPNSIITVNYATPNVAGVTNPCGVDEANIKIAGKWVCSQVIKTTTITRNITSRELIITTGSNTFTLSQKASFNIGTATFSAEQLFNCGLPSDIDRFTPPNPSSDCYSSKVTYDGKTYNVKDKQLISLNPYISMQYFAGGQFVKEDNNWVNQLSGTYYFNIQNPFQMDIQGGITFKQNEAGKIRLNLTNNLPKGNIVIKIQQKVKNTNQNLPEQIINYNANNGFNVVDLPIDTKNLGVNEITISAFYEINADGKVLLKPTLADGSVYSIRISLEILGNQPSIVQFVGKEPIAVEKPIFVETKPVSAEKKESFFDTIPTSVKVIGTILFIGFILTRI